MKDVAGFQQYGLNPGPLLFAEKPDLVWGLIASLFVANVMLVILNIPMIRIFTRSLSVPNWALVPAIAIIKAPYTNPHGKNPQSRPANKALPKLSIGNTFLRSGASDCQKRIPNFSN